MVPFPSKTNRCLLINSNGGFDKLLKWNINNFAVDALAERNYGWDIIFAGGCGGFDDFCAFEWKRNMMWIDPTVWVSANIGEINGVISFLYCIHAGWAKLKCH